MQRPPHNPKRSIFSASVVTLLVLGGLWSTLVGFGLFVGLLDSGRPLEEAMAMTFLALVLIELFEAYSFRSDREPIVHAPFANRWLNVAVVLELGLLPAIFHIPMLHAPFGTFSLTPPTGPSSSDSQQRSCPCWSSVRPSSDGAAAPLRATRNTRRGHSDEERDAEHRETERRWRLHSSLSVRRHGPRGHYARSRRSCDRTSADWRSRCWR